MTGGGGVESVKAIDNRADGAIKAESHGRGLQVIVDGFRDTDDGPAELEQLQARGERAIAADDNEGADAHLFHGAFGLADDFL